MKKFAAATVSGVMCLTLILASTNWDTAGKAGPVQTIHAEAVYDAGTYNVIVTSEIGINLRSGAGSSYEKLCVIDTGTVLTVTEENYGWGKVCYGNYVGYIALHHTQKYNGNISSASSSPASDDISSNYNVKVTSGIGVNMRSGPGSSYSKLAVIDTNTILTVTEENSGWGKVTYGGATGYIALYYTQKYHGGTDGMASAPMTSGSISSDRGVCDFNAAYQYAKAYWNHKNPEYNYYTNNNCANFCSQILTSAGVKTDNRWRNGSVAFINTLYLRDYFVEEYGVTYLENPNSENIAPGDIVYTDSLGHVMFVMAITSDGRILCSGNTNNRDSMPVSIDAICAVLKTSQLF